jgi:hypothetical protein
VGLHKLQAKAVGGLLDVCVNMLGSESVSEEERKKHASALLPNVKKHATAAGPTSMKHVACLSAVLRWASSDANLGVTGVYLMIPPSSSGYLLSRCITFALKSAPRKHYM